MILFPITDQLGRDQLIRRGQRTHGVFRPGHLQGQQPGPVMGFQGHMVAHHPTTFDHLRRRPATVLSLPATAIEAVQHRPTPVEILRIGDRPIETHPEGDLVGLRQMRQITGCHAVSETGHAGVGILGHPPQRPFQARKQHEQHQHQRRRL